MAYLQRGNPHPDPAPDDIMSIYDVIRAMVRRTSWPTEAEQVRLLTAIDHAQQSKVFGTPGMMRL
jgi:hypothetical protein